MCRIKEQVVTTPEFGYRHCLQDAFRKDEKIFSTFFEKTLAFWKSMWYTIQAETKWPVSQAAKTSPSHGEDGGSIPPRVTKNIRIPSGIRIFYYVIKGNRTGRLWPLKIAKRSSRDRFLHRSPKTSVSQLGYGCFIKKPFAPTRVQMAYIMQNLTVRLP